LHNKRDKCISHENNGAGFTCSDRLVRCDAQYVLMVNNRVAAVGETIIRFFSFFTILTNILVAVYFTVNALNLKKKAVHFFYKPSTLTAVTMYIMVVGLVYQFVLRHIWQPEGMQMVVDELLHTFIPSFVFVYWIFDKRKSEVSYSTLPAWLMYPFCYLVFILVRGYASGFYPYPFVHVAELGIEKVLTNSFLLLLVFAGLSIVFIFIARAMKSAA
jgi:hypothetical protein